ncbi:MAG: metallophosphoesterase [Clostridiales bacterium]|nr:metallophosphoesterase [Clostridiales bacterium]
MNLCLNIFQIISILIGVCFVVVCLISFIENRRLVVTSYELWSTKLPKAFEGFHIIQLSDLHNACFGENNSNLIERIRKLEPDVIFVTGDMIVGKPGKDVRFAADTMNQLVSIAPVYMSLGNHELRTSIYTESYGSMWKDFLERLDSQITILRDEKIFLEHNGEKIALYGLDLTPKFYKRFKHTPMKAEYLNDLFGKCEQEFYHIFLAHNPDYFKQYAGWGADLTFSGHVHGGMIQIPFLGGVLSPMVHFFPEYDKGVFEYSNKYMILSGGLGNHTFKFRVNNLPEIVSVTLNPEMN